MASKLIMKDKDKKKQLHKYKPASQLLTEITPAKKWGFRILSFLFSVLFLIIIELGLRIFRYGEDLSLFVSTPSETSVYYGINQNIGKRYFYSDSFSPSPRKDLFFKKKPENGYRIFVLGGSTTAGFPYGNNVTFTRILHRRLSDTFPDRKIEVINTALTAVNSYTLLDFTDEIIDYQPDAILIYAGHNEFYGALGVASLESLGWIRSIVKINLKLRKYKTFIWLRDVYQKVRLWLLKKTAKKSENDPMKTVMTRIVNQEITIPYGSRLYNLGEKQFQGNLHDILLKLTKSEIPVIMSELISNISDQPPFLSARTNSLPPAQYVYKTAQRLEKENKIEEARKAYYRAKDLDLIKFRATEEFNEIIHHMAKEFDTPVVPMKAAFEKESPRGLIGNHLIHEHLHPNIHGYFLMADAFYHTMRKHKLIQSHWPEQNIKPSSYYQKNWGFTPLDSTYAAMNILHLKGGWPFKQSGPNIVLYQFKPKTKEDSVVLNILKTGRLTLELGHIQLARHFENSGYFKHALEEYKALIYTVPTLDLFYEPAIQLLLKTEQYDQALRILYEGSKYNHSTFMLQWIGQLHLALHDPLKGIEFLEKADNLGSNDIQLLYNLARAYYNTAQFSKGDNILARLKEMYPKASLVRELEIFRRSAG